MVPAWERGRVLEGGLVGCEEVVEGLMPGQVGEELASWGRGLERGERVSWVVEGWCGGQ